MKKLILAFNCLMIAAGGMQGSESEPLTHEEQGELEKAIKLSLSQKKFDNNDEQTSVTTLDDLPDLGDEMPTPGNNDEQKSVTTPDDDEIKWGVFDETFQTPDEKSLFSERDDEQTSVTTPDDEHKGVVFDETFQTPDEKSLFSEMDDKQISVTTPDDLPDKVVLNEVVSKDELERVLKHVLSKESVTTIDDLPEFVILDEILPKLDDKSLLNLARSSKKYENLCKNEFAKRRKIRTYLREFSRTFLEELIKSSEVLKKCLAEDKILKDLSPSSELLKHYAEIELEHINMLEQRNEFQKRLVGGLLLNLSFQEIEVLFPGVFDAPAFKNLQELNLSNNKLTSLPKNIFKELKKLEQLDLGNNQLTILDKDMFEGLKNLEGLNLCNNNLTENQLKAFDEIKNTVEQRKKFREMLSESGTNLDLLDCDINVLYKGVFDAAVFKNLQKLNLSNNKLTNLDKEIFNELKNLKELELAYNLLTELDIDIFKKLKNLKMLNLFGNELTKDNIKKLRSALSKVKIFD